MAGTSGQAARKALEKRLAKGSKFYGTAPETLKLSEIKTLEDVFQFRKPLPHKSDAHKRRLGRCVQRKGEALGRLLVWWGGDAWFCIDGHHRLAAYQQSDLENVPVEVFAGAVREAVKEALLRNTEDKLQMEDRERTAAAWRLVSVWNEAYSKAEIAEMASVGPATVGKMRQVFKQLKEERPGVDLSDISWKQARELAKGNDEGGGDAEEWKRQQIAKIRDKLLKAFGLTLGRRPDILAEALREYDEDLPGALRDAFREMEANEEQSELEPGELPFPGPKDEQEEPF